MEIKSRFDHFNINVLDLERSIAFYNKALGLKEHHRKEAKDGSFILVYLTDDQTGFLLELTWLKDRNEPYELGDNESHLCFRVAGDYEEIDYLYGEMTFWMMQKGYEPEGTAYEFYYRRKEEPFDDRLTKIVLPVKS